MNVGGALALTSASSVLSFYNPTSDISNTVVTANVGSITAVSGSQIQMDIFTDSNSDRIISAGIAQMDGELLVRAGVGTYANKEFVLVDAAALSGLLVDDILTGNPTLASLDTTGIAGRLFGTYHFDILTNTIRLTISGTSASNLSQMHGMSFNQREVAATLDVLSATSSADLAAVINSLIGSNATQGGTLSALSEISPYFLANVLRPQLNNSSRAGIYNRIENYCPGCSNNGLWIEADVGQEELGSNDNSINKFKLSASDIKIGFDRYFFDSDIMLGGFVSYSPKKMKQNGSKADVDSLGAGVYAGRIGKKWDIKSMVGFSFDNYDVKRKIYSPTVGLNRTAASNFDGTTVNADIEAGYKVPLNNGMELN